MGYYTYHSLEFDESETEVVVALEEGADSYSDGVSLMYDAWTGNAERTKWYSHDEDMKTFSKRFPHVLFELSGEGEESGDIWKAYYKDGKVQLCRAKIVFDEYDESKLK